MVRTYKKKTNRGQWTPRQMKEAVDKVICKQIGYRKAAQDYNVPQTTLERYVKKVRQGNEISFGLPLGPMKPVFTKKEEYELVSYLKNMEERLFGLTTIELRKLAYQLAEKNRKKHNFNSIKQMAGLDWLNGFLKRHPDLSIRKPEATSAARAMGFNRVAVGKFYELLGEIYDKHQLTPDKIYNCDETGISIVSKTKSKIIAMKGRKQVGSLSSAERGQTITVEICFNAAGSYMPPLMIFPRQRMKAELLDHAPPGTTAECNARGWMTTEIFFKWFQKFILFSGASPSNRVLLLLDGHVSHTQNIEVIDLAREKGVIILCFPPHCTHKLQPADVAFMRPLSTYYDQAATSWLRSHPGRVVTTFQISEIFGQAYIQAATMTTAINAFKKCGIWPYNENNFSDADFIAAETTNIPVGENSSNVDGCLLVVQPAQVVKDSQSQRAVVETESASVEVKNRSASAIPEIGPGSPSILQENPASIAMSCLSALVEADFPYSPAPEVIPSTPIISQLVAESYITPTSVVSPAVDPKPGCSYACDRHSPIRAACRDLTTCFDNASPGDIIAIPFVGRREKRKQYRRGKTAVITSTPYKTELEQRKQGKKCANPNDLRLKKNAKKNKKKGEKQTRQITQKTNDDVICLYCNDENHTYLRSSEGWVGCQLCGRWAHTACAGVDDADLEEVHICVHCENPVLPQ